MAKNTNGQQSNGQQSNGQQSNGQQSDEQQSNENNNAHKFIHLHNHTAYSMAEGAIRINDLAKHCKENNIPAVAMTDTNNIFGAFEFSKLMKAEGVQPIIGAQLGLYITETDKYYDSKRNSLSYPSIVLLVQNEIGYKNLCKLFTHAYMHSKRDDNRCIDMETLAEHGEGLICLTGGNFGILGLLAQASKLDIMEDVGLKLKDIFNDRLYVEIMKTNPNVEVYTEPAFLDFAFNHNIPLVATNDCYYINQDMYEAHDALTCISTSTYVVEKDRRHLGPEHYFKSPTQMIEEFSHLPEAIENTVKIAKRCGFMIKPLPAELPTFATEESRTEEEELRFQSLEGLKERLKHSYFKDFTEEDYQRYFDRLDYELDVIISMKFPGYFLIVSDFIKYAKSQDIPVGPGRGSGAGSIVAWSLKITDLDPLRFKLLFERFLNPERVSMPDFDIDFCQTRREEVIQYVQRKYGVDKVAQIVTFGKMKAKNAIRDVGRVLSMPYGQVDRISKLIPGGIAPLSIADSLKEEPKLRQEMNAETSVNNLINIAQQLEGLYRNAGTHAAGVVIGNRPIEEIVAVYKDPNSTMPVTQFNMKYVEDVSLVKFDFLGLKTLTVISETLKFIKKSRNIEIDMSEIDLYDEKTYEMLTEGHTVGVFQLESDGMRKMIRELKPTELEDLIAIVALYRPGPMDQIPTYIARKHGREKPDYLGLDILEPILKETYGIMIYQEQVMQLAQTLGGYTLGGADILRRAMGKKIEEEMIKQASIFIQGAKEHHGVDEKHSKDIFDKVQKFASYGFNKSHAAAYALISYQTAFLKANYTEEFLAGSMSLDLSNTDKLAVFVDDAKELGIKILPPDINKSYTSFNVEILAEGKKGIRYALAGVKGVGEGNTDVIVQERQENGEFKNITDFLTRVNYKAVSKKTIENLIKSGTFDSIDDNRKKLFENTDSLVRYARLTQEEEESGQDSLFGAPEDDASDDKTLNIPDIPDWLMSEKMENELKVLGFYLTSHPLHDFVEDFKIMRGTLVKDIKKSQQVKIMGVISEVYQTVSKKGNPYGIIKLSDPSSAYEVLIFKDGLEKYEDILEVNNQIIIEAKAEIDPESGHLSLLSNVISTLNSKFSKSINEITLEIRTEKASQNIVNQLKSLQAGGTSVNLRMKIDGTSNYAKIILEDKYHISHEVLSLMKAYSGVTLLSRT